MSKVLLLPVLLVMACTSQTTSSSEVVETSAIDVPSSTSSELIEARPEDRVLSDTANIAPDSSLYIGEVFTFAGTGEVYTSVYYHGHVDTEGLFDYLQEQTDSVMYEDAEIKRTRIPISIARNYFNLLGLDTISVYENAQYVGDARFVRVEYLEDVIEGMFIAVFKPLGSASLPEELDYCVSKGKHHHKTISVTYEEIEDEQLTAKLLKAFVGDSVRVWRTLHMRMLSYQSVYSAVSMQSRLLLIETNDGQSRILMDLQEDWFISDIVPLHLERNGKPMLLLRMGVNETDIVWSAVATFSGEGYGFGEGNRIGVLVDR